MAAINAKDVTIQTQAVVRLMEEYKAQPPKQASEKDFSLICLFELLYTTIYYLENTKKVYKYITDTTLSRSEKEQAEKDMVCITEIIELLIKNMQALENWHREINQEMYELQTYRRLKISQRTNDFNYYYYNYNKNITT